MPAQLKSFGRPRNDAQPTPPQSGVFVINLYLYFYLIYRIIGVQTTRKEKMDFMKKFLKWLGIVLGAFLGLIVIVLLVLYVKANTALTQTYNIPADNITIPTDADSVARGKKWADTLCVGCHTANLSGQTLISAPFGTIDSANLTSGNGGVGAKFKDTDWVRVLRHGVDEEGHPVVLMPAQEFWHLSDQDLGDIVAYLKTLPPVDHETHDWNFNFVGKVMIGANIFGADFIPAAIIQHDQRPNTPAASLTVDYGAYLVSVSGCYACHGPHLSGGKSAKPGALGAPNLTPGGELQAWKVADFINTIRTGTAPSGHNLNPAEMPWKDFNNYSDDELKAIYLYLQNQPALASTTPK